MSANPSRYYQASGAVSVPAAIVMLIAGIAVAGITAFPFAFLPLFMESVIIAFLCGVGPGLLVGFSVRCAGRLAEVRNPDFSRFVGFVAALFAVYFVWVAHVWIHSGYNLNTLTDRLNHPLHLLRDMQQQAALGIWSIFGVRPVGWQLYAIWIAEATSVICLSVACSADDSATYCEHCKRWTQDSGVLLQMPSGQPDELRAALEAERYDVLDSLRRQPFKEKDLYEGKISECPTCRDSNYLSVQHVTEIIDSEGDPQRVENAIVTNLIVPYELLEHLRLPVFDGSPEYEASQAADSRKEPSTAEPEGMVLGSEFMRLRLSVAWCVAVLVSPCTSGVADDVEQAFALKCRDGFTLDGTYRLPAKTETANAKRVVILLHGSGPHSMDADLTAVTRDGRKNLFFKDIATALSSAGFVVVRYNKRSYQSREAAKKDRAFVKTKVFQDFVKNPLKYFVDDARDCVKWSAKKFPAASVYLLGHSQGTYLALQVAGQDSQVKGVALVGFYLSSLDTLVFEQTVNRPMSLFTSLDTNGDQVIDQQELKSEKKIAALLRAQMKVIDLDADGRLAKVEYQAANYSNLIVRDLLGSMRRQEAAYPRPAEILKGAKFQVAFFQGLLDNQTPAYHTKAVELIVRNVTKKPNFRFHYFPGLGHALDKRDGYDDLKYNTIDDKAKQSLATELNAFFK
eukprot:g8316.t1